MWNTNEKHKQREELAFEIMCAAIKKVEALGFTMMLRDRDSKRGANMSRRIVKAERITFYYPSK